MSYLFTSESVSEGHPDKVADAISDAVLDLMMREGNKAYRCACETLVGCAIEAQALPTFVQKRPFRLLKA